ncbi:MAG: hypothetical protein LC624_03485 [Halobacteriales archaeon]|nr:hypothetical protein [Halobacteriales archaeon]
MRAALVLALLLLLPAFAAAAPRGPQPVAVWMRSDGSAGLGSVDRVRTCDGTAPLVNTCTLEGLNTGFWQVGFFVVPTPALGLGSVSLLSGKVRVASPEDPANAAEFACDFADAALGPYTGRDPPAYRCVVLRTATLTGPTVRAEFHIGAFDPSLYVPAAPSTNDVEAGVGPWTGFLTTLFE